MLDIDHLFEMVQLVLNSEIRNQTIYLVNPVCYKVPEIISAFSSLLGKKADCISVPKGDKFSFDTDLSRRVFHELNINTDSYLEEILAKYYTDGNTPYPNNS